MSNATHVVSGTRAFLPPSLTIECWEDIEPYFRDLAARPLNCKADLEKWISDKSDLDAVITEAFSWMYIHISRNNQDQEALERYQFAVQHIQPQVASQENLLNQRLVQSPFFDQLDTKQYWIYQRKVKNAVELFCEQNVPITTEVQLNRKNTDASFHR